MPPSLQWRRLSFVAALVLAAVLLYYSLRGLDWRQVAATVSSADISLLALVAVLASTNLLLRSLRWRILLEAAVRVPPSTTFWATAAGYFGNTFLPARAGELVRTLMISARTGLAVPFVLATALSERIADACALLLIGALALMALPSRPGWLAEAAVPSAILALVGAICIAVLPKLESIHTRIIDKLPLAPAIAARIRQIVEQGVLGLRAFHDKRRFAAFASLSLVIWVLDAIATVIGAAALGLRMPLPVAFLLIVGLGLGSALPSTPGYVGIYQFVAVSVLTPFGFSQSEAIAYILVAQAMTFAVIGFWGSLGFWRYRAR
jgi:uncharacterized protein (TIRG00374 family)